MYLNFLLSNSNNKIISLNRVKSLPCEQEDSAIGLKVYFQVDVFSNKNVITFFKNAIKKCYLLKSFKKRWC